MQGGGFKIWAAALAVLCVTSAASAPLLAQEQDPATLDQRATELVQNGKTAEAIPLAEKYAAVMKSQHGAESAQYVLAASKLAVLYESSARYNDAEPLYRQVIQIFEKVLGPDHPNLASPVSSLGKVLHAANRSQEAEPLLRRALALNEKALGAEHANVAVSLSNLAVFLVDTNRLAEAEPLYRRALAIQEKTLGAEAPNVAITLNNLALLLQRGNRLGEAEPLLRRSLAINEKIYGADHPATANTFNNLAALLKNTNRLAEAEPLFRRALAIDEKALGTEHPKVAVRLNNLADLLQATNRLAEAEQLYRRALAINEKSLGPEHPDVARILGNLGLLLKATNRVAEAEPLFRRALAIYERSDGADHPNVANGLNNLASLYQATNRLAEAKPLLQRALTIYEKSYGPTHPDLAAPLNNLANVLAAGKDFRGAEPLLRRATAIDEKSFGPNHPSVARDLNNLAQLLQNTHRLAEAEPLYRRALAIDEKSYGRDHPETATDLINLAWLRAAQPDWPGALKLMTRATAINIVSARRLRGSSTEAEKRLLKNSAADFRGQVLMAFRASPKDAGMRENAFELAQWAIMSDAAGALTQASARFAAGTDALAALVRERQDLAAKREATDQQLLDAVGRADNATAERLRQEQAGIDARLDAMKLQLVREFPGYAALANPEPLTIPEIQALLAPDEAMVLFLPLMDSEVVQNTSFAWAITRTEARWVELPLGGAIATREVLALRCALDDAAWDNDGARQCRTLLGVAHPSRGKPLPFDLARAHRLYHALFGQFAALLEGKRLLIAPSGALSALPFQVLVTAPPAKAIPGNWEGYRGAKWLGRERAITILPSVASLKALRGNAKPSQARDPFIGFGDPALMGNPHCGKIVVPTLCPGDAGEDAGTGPLSNIKSWFTTTLPSYFRGGLADVDAVRKLCPLPDTSHELKCVAKSLGAPLARVITGEGATETAVKSAPLDRYRVVHFATHGLLSDESATLGMGDAEPALVLTPPAIPTTDDDGLLTASEVTQLKLNADWVVLSACNTASGNQPGGEALSGLTRAFFYAGARTLIVSHWPVDSNAATTITSTVFKAQRDEPGISPAEAMRRSVVALMADKRPWNAHPTFWAPFVVVGGGQ